MITFNSGKTVTGAIVVKANAVGKVNELHVSLDKNNTVVVAEDATVNEFNNDAVTRCYKVVAGDPTTAINNMLKSAVAVNSSATSGFSSWTLDTSADATVPTITNADNGKYVVVVDVCSGKIAAVGGSAKINITATPVNPSITLSATANLTIKNSAAPSASESDAARIEYNTALEGLTIEITPAKGYVLPAELDVVRVNGKVLGTESTAASYYEYAFSNGVGTIKFHGTGTVTQDIEITTGATQLVEAMTVNVDEVGKVTTSKESGSVDSRKVRYFAIEDAANVPTQAMMDTWTRNMTTADVKKACGIIFGDFVSTVDKASFDGKYLLAVELGAESKVIAAGVADGIISITGTAPNPTLKTDAFKILNGTVTPASSWAHVSDVSLLATLNADAPTAAVGAVEDASIALESVFTVKATNADGAQADTVKAIFVQEGSAIPSNWDSAITLDGTKTAENIINFIGGKNGYIYIEVTSFMDNNYKNYYAVKVTGAPYGITVNEPTGKSVTVTVEVNGTEVTEAIAGSTVTLTAAAAGGSGATSVEFTVTGADNEVVGVTGSELVYTFTMPAKAVTIDTVGK